MNLEEIKKELLLELQKEMMGITLVAPSSLRSLRDWRRRYEKESMGNSPKTRWKGEC